MKKIIAFFALGCLFQQTHASVIPEKSFMINTDFSYSSARDLWKKDGTEHSFVHNGEETSQHGKTKFYQLGLTLSYGLMWDSQVDLRFGYAKSTIVNANHPNAAAGGQDSEVTGLNEVTLKFTKNLYHGKRYSFDAMIGYKHPVEDTPENPTFIAINDFSSHILLGIKNAVTLNKYFSVLLDITYKIRSTADKLDALDLPEDQLTVDLILPYAIDWQHSLGITLNWQHTFGGPNIGEAPGWGQAVTAAGHPPFYAAEEKFVGASFFFNYYFRNGMWTGISRFKKFWGRNTDRSRTWTLFWGMMF